MRLEYFQLIDRIVEIDVHGRTLQAEALVPQASPIFEGHFPGHPLMPGVLLIESMAQASGWLVIALERFQRMPFLAAVKEGKLRAFVAPGSRLAVSASLVHSGSGYAMTKAAIAIDGKTVCNAELTFRVMPFPDPGFRAMMEKTALAIEFPSKALADD